MFDLLHQNSFNLFSFFIIWEIFCSSKCNKSWNNDLVTSYLFTYLLFSIGSKLGSNGGSSYIHLEHSYFFFRARSRLLSMSNNVKYLNIRIQSKTHLLVIWAIIAAIINSNVRVLQTRVFSSHRLDNDWVGIIQKSPILYRSFKARMFFLLGKLRVTGSWSWERWDLMDGARQRHF